MRKWLAAALMLAATAGWAETGKVGPPKSEFKDGPFFVSWRYATPSSGMVYATPKLRSSDPPRLTAGEAFEVSITIRIPKEGPNPCVTQDSESGCSMHSHLVLIDPKGNEAVYELWHENGVLHDGLHTFSLKGTVPADALQERGYIKFRLWAEGESLVKEDTFPVRINRR